MDPISSNDLALRNSCLVELVNASRIMYSTQSCTIVKNVQSHKGIDAKRLTSVLPSTTYSSLLSFSVERESRKMQQEDTGASKVLYDELSRTAVSFSVEREARRQMLESQKDETTVQIKQATQSDMRLVHDLDDIEETFVDVLNPHARTFGRHPRLDRVTPSVPTEEQRIIAAADVVKPMVFSAHMTRVQEGVMVINNVPIPVDPARDSLADVLSRISGSAADVHAHFDPRRNKVVIESLNNSSVNITQDTSNFLEEVNVRLGNYTGTTDLVDSESVIDLIT